MVISQTELNSKLLDSVTQTDEAQRAFTEQVIDVANENADGNDVQLTWGVGNNAKSADLNGLGGPMMIEMVKDGFNNEITSKASVAKIATTLKNLLQRQVQQ